MQPFSVHAGRVLPLDRVNVDTDQVVPKQFIKLQVKTGFGRFLFYDWRYLPGEIPNPEFILNWPRYRGASVLLGRANFGCGSSREHAPWALADYGFKVLIAPSYADIFYNNCFKNGILPIVVSPEDLDKLFDDAERGANARLSVDLETQEIRGPDGGIISFEVDSFRKHCLLEGLDDIGLTMARKGEIERFEAASGESRPWA